MEEEYAHGSQQERSRVPDDTLFYSIFPAFAAMESATDSISAEAELKLKELQVNLLDIVFPFVKDYIWQHESFNVKPSLINPYPHIYEDSNPSPPVPHLHGKIRYGDNIEDEWFVVFLLYEISKKMPDVSVRVWDSDGEFLLIEAAYALPRWLKPENSRNRVFIRRGELHIVPLPSSPAEIYHFPVKLSVVDAIRVLTGGFVDTRADDAIQKILDSRIRDYPGKARENMHRTRVRIPLSVAQVLKHDSRLISLAVEAFYDRDVDSMKAASKMEKFLGNNKEMVDVSVRMSKAMYAQLVQQAFQAPRCYPMPPLSAANYGEADLGMKISCGFEMIYYERSKFSVEEKESADGYDSNDACTLESGKLKAPVSKDAGWESFRKSLEEKGYYKGLLEGSKQYQRLLNEAVDYYRRTTLFSKTSSVMHAPVKRIDEILAWPHSTEDFLALDVPPSDDDLWLYNGEEDLNAALHKRQMEMDLYEAERLRRKHSKKPKETGSTSKKNMDDLAKCMHAFVEKASSFEGVEVPRSRNSETVTLDTRQFLKELKSAMGDDSKNKGFSSQEESMDDSDHSSSDTEFDEAQIDSSEADGDDMTKETEVLNDGFMDEYSDALDKQLKNSTLTKTFIQAEDASTTGDKNKSQTGTGGENDDLMPVDVDFNLVQSLLDSFSSQQGMPGPTSNLFGLMGLQLPNDSQRK